MASISAPSTPLQPLKGGALVLGTVALSLATFMNVLDSSIANVSLPAIAGDLGVSPNQGTWVITSFAVANAISVPLTGWLTQRFGSVRLFITSVLLFVLTSWLCGFAPSLGMLIFFRVLQGLVAGPMIPLSQTLLLSSYPRAKAGTALAMWSMTTLVAPVVGPLLGGWITDNVAWPWIFYINIPIGLLAALATWSVYRKRETPIKKLPIDSVGLGLMVTWITAMQIMLDKGKELDWFHSGQITLLAVVTVAGLALFITWELTEEHPVVDLRLFARRNFLIGSSTLALAYGIVFGNVVLLPLWLQQFMGYTASAAGMALAPVGILAIVLSPVVGRQVGRIDPRWIVTVSFLVFALVLGMRARFTTQAGEWDILVPTLLQGAAMALFFIPLNTIYMSGIEPDRWPAASGLANFVRITMGAVGTSVATTVWEDRATLHRVHMVEHLGGQGDAVMGDALSRLSGVGLDAQQAAAQLSRLLDQQAFTRAVDDVFYASSLLFIVMIIAVWFTRRAARPSGDASSSAAAAH